MSEKSDETSFLFKGKLGHLLVIPLVVQFGVAGLVDEMASSWATLIFAQIAVFATSFFTSALKRSPLRSILVGAWPALFFAVFRVYDRMDIYSPERPIANLLSGSRYWLAAYAALTFFVAFGGWLGGRSMNRA